MKAAVVVVALFDFPNKVLGEDIGPGMSRTKTPFPVVLEKEWPGCGAIWGGTSWEQKSFMQESFGAEFLFPTQTPE